ncbi:MAG: hypothetical protein JXB23_15340, partial [Candidatus Aminicenantes bacterium]|nr:hypothetical protein [Candidatus Aminicenantes bacterium]
SLFERQQTLSERIFSRLQESYRQIIKPHLPSWAFKGQLETEAMITGDSTALFEALTQAFFILRETGNGAVIIDDIDQIDPPSLQFFGSQFSQQAKGSLHFVSSISTPELTATEEKLLRLSDAIPELTVDGKIKIFHLEPLKPGHIQQLVDKLFDGASLPNKTAAALAQNSRGNPLFIVEALSTLLQERKISVKNDTWDVSNVKPKDIPTSLNSMIENRLSLLDKEAVTVLKLASVLGEKINPKLIAEISKLKLQQVMNAISDAQRSLFIEESPNPDEYVFSHRMGRSVFYSLMDEKERHKLHAIAAKTEQKFAADEPERIVGRLAYHFHNAGQLEKAAEMLTTLKHQMEAVHISKGTQKLLQKRIISASIAKESSLEEEDLAKAIIIGKGFRSSMQNLRLYPRANENVKRSLNDFMENLEPFLEEKTEVLSISVTPEATLFNGQSPPSHFNDPKLTEDLYATMNNYGLQGVLLLKGITREETVRFLEFFKRHPRDVINRWDELLEQQEISHILPDRKIFVAVGEHKVLLGKSDIYAQPSGEGTEEGSEYDTRETLKLSEEHIKQLQNILDQFTKEKQELMNALDSSDIDRTKLDKITKILSDTNIDRLAQSIHTAIDLSSSEREDLEALDEAVDKVIDLKFIEKVEGDISLAFEELSSPESSIRAKAATWLVNQEPKELAEAGMKAITSDFPYKFRRIAAGVLNQAGEAAVTAFLSKISPTMPTITLNKVIKIADAFIDNPELSTAMREIALNGPFDTLSATIDILKKIPGGKADSILLDMFNRTMGRTKWELITVYAEHKIKKAAPLLFDYIRPRKIWQKEQDLSLQEHICRTLGILRSPESVEILVRVASESKLHTLNKSKPEFIRAAATWALTQMPQSKRVDRALDALKKDRSVLVRKAAELSEIIRED